MNYTIKAGDFKPLSDIMDQDYETTKDYIIHVNKGYGSVLQVLTTTDTPTNEERGVEYPEFAEIEVSADTGDDVYLRSNSQNLSIDIVEKVV